MILNWTNWNNNEGGMKKNIICDFDSTIVSVETLDELAKFIMHKEQYDVDRAQKIEDITELGMQGKISFAQSLYMRLELMHITQKDIADFREHVLKAVTVLVDKNCDFIKKNRDNMYIVSGGFHDLILPVTRYLGFRDENIYTNTFTFDTDGVVSGFDENNHLAGPKGKARQVAALQLNGHIMMVGDGWTDYEVKEQEVADSFVAFVEHVYRPHVVEHADYVAGNFDEVIKIFKKI
jgi:D-3-phosphoglycerate dehydrogenase / 2-oxoglutarate reductase